MARTYKIAVLVGSLRKGSLNRQLAHVLADLAPPSLKLEIVEIGELPYYNQDLEPEPPAAWAKFRDEIRAADAVLFLTPEYNRSVPAVLKNAVDVGSRPYGKGVLVGKPSAVISSSPGALGAFGANHHLRQALVGLSSPTMSGPEAYLGGADKFFGADGKLANAGTHEFLQKFMNAFADWVATHTKS